MRRSVLVLATFATLFGCAEGDEKKEPKLLASDESTAPVEVVGVAAEDFECETVAPEKEIRAALGHDFEAVDTSFHPPAGVPEPCHYVGRTEERPSWSFDIDCRESAIEDGEALMVHYAKQPESSAVAVGQSGLDHSGASLLFIDDDSPCYVRVLGPDAEGRLALARVVARRLTERTAPAGRSFRETE